MERKRVVISDGSNELAINSLGRITVDSYDQHTYVHGTTGIIITSVIGTAFIGHDYSTNTVRVARIDSNGRVGVVIGTGTNRIGTVGINDGTNDLLVVKDATVIPSGSTGVLIAGTDGTNSHFLVTDASGKLQVDVVSMNDGGNEITVNGSVSVNSIPSIPAGTNAIGSVIVTALPAISGSVQIDDGVYALEIGKHGVPPLSGTGIPVMGWDGTNLLRLHVNSTGYLETIVTQMPAIPAGTSNIGSVNVAVVVPGTGATNLGKASGAAFNSGDTLVGVLGVRNDNVGSDSLLSPLGGNGNYGPITFDEKGQVYTTEEYLWYLENFTTAGVGVTKGPFPPKKYWSLQATPNAATTTWTVELQVSQEGSYWTTILTHVNGTDAANSTKVLSTPFPARYARINVTALNGAVKDVTAHLVGVV